ncbi:hypothetical protein [Pseudonocardia parietis]|uniref:Uncharacterized protein n=1 Tax=Pseudonocardia parietis TaxID=570936 RepID=A0ABS4VT73_9PSEU|nr:hypothetical protein [Pseudonocardia parietis]MBP2366759.1 hypothetical protein [Pseudonocardia parietis]
MSSSAAWNSRSISSSLAAAADNVIGEGAASATPRGETYAAPASHREVSATAPAYQSVLSFSACFLLCRSADAQTAANSA